MARSARTFRASITGIEMANKAFERTGWTQDYLAGSVKCSRPKVSHFLPGKPCNKNLFQELCRELDLKWQEIVDWEQEELSIKYRETCNTPDITTTPTDKTEKRVAYAIAGTVDKVDLPQIQALIALLQKKTGDFSIEIVDIEEGSVRLILEGSQAGLEQIETLFKSGQFNDVLGIPVLDAQFVNAEDSEQDKKRLVFTIDASISPEDLQAVKAALTKNSNINKEIKTNKESRLVQEIRSQGAMRRDLIGTDLSGADLSSANLSGADLRGSHLNAADLSGAKLSSANLSGADLSSANLSGADLRGSHLNAADLSGAKLSSANLSGADLSGADLSGADLSSANLSGVYLSAADLRGTDLSGANLSSANLSGAYLSGVNLSGANVENAQFEGNLGITEQMKQELIQRGAIFNDSPGDRSKSLVPH